MTPVPPPLTDAVRAPLLPAYDLVDAPPDPELAQVARLAAAVCGVPTATVNLLDETQQHQIATHGLVGSSSPRSEAMCDVTARSAAPVVVADARADARFRDNPWVTGQRGQVRFYAAQQLRDDEGRVVGTLCVFDTERRRLTEQQTEALADLAEAATRLLKHRREAHRVQEQLQALDRANADLAAFAGRVAHDLRGPLTGVLGFLQVAQRRGGTLPPLVDTCLEQAGLAAGRMQEMLDGLLRFATAGTAAAPQPVDLDRLLRQICGDLQQELSRSGTRLEVSALGSTATDPLLLGQVLQNLLGNALKYRSPDRPSVVRVTRTDDAAGGCTLTVSDSGRGIPAAERATVFELFRRAHNAGEVEGHGIGLATCARNTAALGGTLELADTAGGGLTVHLHLPPG